MTDFEMFSFGIFTGIILTLLIIFVLVLRDKNDDKDLCERESNTDNNNNIYNTSFDREYRSVDRPIPLYKKGEISNVGAIVALKNILREMKNMLSEVEKDSIEKGIKALISIEKLYAFIECEEKEKEEK